MLRRTLYLLAPAAVIAALSSHPRVARGGEPLLDDGIPRGTIAFFGDRGACPPGWSVAEETQGRLVVGVTEPTAVGQTVGMPLRDREDRTHTHQLTGTVTLPPRSIAGANGGNTQGARNGEYTAMGAAAPAPSGLPFVQVRACVKQ